MPKNLIVVMDDIAKIKPVKDTTFAFLLEGMARGYSVYYLNISDLWLDEDQAMASMRAIEVRDHASDWYCLGEPQHHAFGDEDVVLMRKDPPVDANYIYSTLILDRAQAQGARVINEPRALRDFNEKLAITYFGQWMPPTCVSTSHQTLKGFIKKHRKVVVKPLDGMGGRGIFLIEEGEANVNAILETLTGGEQRLAMAQAFLPEIAEGDKRVLVVDGEVVPFVLARIPGEEDFRGNLAQGGRGEGQPITATERAIAEAVAPTLKARGVMFAGLDIIGQRLTEVNVTSPTCVRELDQQFGLNISGQLFDAIEAQA